jgi:3-oxoacyl-[acyl-carrier protein] reductase
MTWQNQVAVVTGGSRGIGRATALLLARRGAAVCVNYAGRADAAEAVMRKISSAGGRAIAVQADVADVVAMTSMIDKVAEELGPVTIVINNAGISHQASLDTYDAEQFDRMRRVNVDGVIHSTRAVLAGMRERRYGRIVNLASIAALGTAMPGTTFYAATKAAVISLTRRWAMELGPYGITVNAVAPGFVRTDMTEGHRSKEEWESVEKELGQRAMTKRIGEPEDIANAAVFLAAPESGWITAQLLVVDGGRMDYIGHG